MTKFQYSPGLPGYGNQGVDGSIGLGGLGTYFTPFNGQSGQNSITTRIAANAVLFGAATPLPGYPSRQYQTGDIIIDVIGAVYSIDLNTINLFTSIGATLSSESFFGFQANVPATGYARYSNGFGSGERKTVDSVYSIDGLGYLTRPDECYINTASEFGTINFNNISGLASASGDDYAPFMLFTAGGTDAEAIAIVKNNASNLWRFGNLTGGGTQQPIEMHFDFSDLYVNGDLTVAGDLTGAYVGTINITDESADTGAFPVFVNAATGQRLLHTNAGISYNTLTQKLSLGGGLDINSDATSVNSTGALTFGSTNLAGIYYSLANDAIVIKNDNTTGKIYIDAEGDIVEIRLSGTTTATFDTVGLNLVSSDRYAIAGVSVLNNNTLGSGVINSSLTSVGIITSGTWQGTTVAVNQGGTGATTFTSNAVLTGNGTSAIQAESGVTISGTTISAITFSGNATTATTATTATNATNVNVSVSTTSASRPFVFATSVTSGNKILYTDSATTCYINPGTNVIGATTFIGALSGNATTSTTSSSTSGNAATASVATQVKVTDNDLTNTNYGIIFSDLPRSQTGTVNVDLQHDDTTCYYNPSLGLITSTDFAATSDERLKENFVSIGPVLDKIISLKGTFSTFDWIKNKNIDIGYSAQTIQSVFPEIVTITEDSVDIENKLSLKYQKIGGIALEGIAELNVKLESEIDDLKLKNSDLKERLDDLEEKINILLNQ